MANPPSNTYMNIPPPPLPEFYLSASKNKDSASSALGTDTEVRAEASVFIERNIKSSKANSDQSRPAPQPGDGVDERWRYGRKPGGMTTIDVTLPASPQDDVPPLAVYHICRICLRPRSARYHRDHPIPIDGVPPPPSICRRCRLSSVEELKSVTEVVETSESGDVKLGLKCLLPEEDYYTNEEMRTKRANYVLENLDQAEWKELEPPPAKRKEVTYQHAHGKLPPPLPRPSPKEETEVVYRHVHIDMPPQPPPRSLAKEPEEVIYRRRYVNLPPPPPPLSPKRPNVTVTSTAQDAVDNTSNKSTKPTATAVARSTKAQPFDVIEPQNLDSAKAAVFVHASSSRFRHRSSTHHASVSTKPAKPERTESEIRRLARDEVERYRQAERKMEAHGDAYAHGRLVPVERVPVERRIDVVRDVAQERPWEKPSESSRKDSAVASSAAYHEKHRERKYEKQETVVVQSSHKNADCDKSWPPVTSEQDSGRTVPGPSSSTSSDKTRWPSTREEGKSRAPESNQPPIRKSYEVYGIVDEPSRPDEGNRERRSSIVKYDIIEVEPGTAPSEPKEAQMRRKSVRREPKVSDRVEELRIERTALRQERDQDWQSDSQAHLANSHSGKCTERGYWSDDQPGRTDGSCYSKGEAAAAQGERLSGRSKITRTAFASAPTRHGQAQTSRQTAWTGEDIRSSATVGRASDQKEKSTITVARQQSLPYPGDDHSTPVSMPSPRSHTSRAATSPTKSNLSWNPGSEYYYVRRTVQPADEPLKRRNLEDTSGSYYKETEEYLHRRKSPGQSQPKSGSQMTGSRVEPKRRPSDASSRVRFSSKVDVSPTPPGSDANSSEFRRFGRVEGQIDGHGSERGEDVIAEYERRGRSRSRGPLEDNDYYYERDTVRSRQSGYLPPSEIDRDRTPRPGPRSRRPSGETETATLPSNVRPLARALSESPSREKLLEAARREREAGRRPKTDGIGPYMVDERRSDSVDVEDGSMLSGGSSSSSDHERHRKRRERHRHGGRRSKR